MSDKLGILPKDYVLFKALVGDPTDNIRGIAGVGPVTAKRIVKGEIETPTDSEGVLNTNIKLITLDTTLDLPQLSGEFIADLDKINQPNKVIFEKCGF